VENLPVCSCFYFSNQKSYQLPPVHVFSERPCPDPFSGLPRALPWLAFLNKLKTQSDKSIFTESVRLMEAGVAPVLQWLPSRTSFKRKKNTKKTHVSEKKLQKNTRFPKKTTY
jgi:hypothetical protein